LVAQQVSEVKGKGKVRRRKGRRLLRVAPTLKKGGGKGFLSRRPAGDQGVLLSVHIYSR